MSRSLWCGALLLLTLGLGGCDGDDETDGGVDAAADSGSADGGRSDAGVDDAGAGDAGQNDAGQNDAGQNDAGDDAGADDAGLEDAGPPAPTVVSVSPLDAATEVARSESIVVTFDTAMDAASFTPDGLIVETAIGTRVAGALSVTGTEATLTPTEELVRGTRYRVTVAATVQSSEGQALGTAFTSTFDTVMPIWTADVGLSDAARSVPGRAGIAAFDGGAVAVWSHNAVDARNVYASTFDGTSWSAPVGFDDPAIRAIDLAVACNRAGAAAAVWLQPASETDAPNVVWGARLTPGSGWSTPTFVARTGPGDARRPAVAVAPSGEAVVLWGRGTSILQGMAATFSAAGVFGAAENIEASGSSASNMRVGVDDAGTFTGIFRLGDEVVSVQRPSGGTWSAAEVLSASPDTILDIGLGVGPAGDAVAAWTQFTLAGGRADVYTAQRPAGGGWGAAELRESDDFDSANSPVVAVDAAGNALLAWNQTRAGNLDAVLTTRYDGSTWSAPEVLQGAATDEDSLSEQRVAMDAAGNAFVVFKLEPGSGGPRVRAFRYQAGVGFLGGVRVGAAAPPDSSTPGLAVSAGGAAYGIFRERAASISQVRAATAR